MILEALGGEKKKEYIDIAVYLLRWCGKTFPGFNGSSIFAMHE